VLDRLFVYGTLMVGHCRWPILEPLVVGGTEGMAPASTDGRLYDTGHDYPAARFDHDGAVFGQVGRLHPEGLAAALDLLDEVEGAVHGHYARVQVLTHDGSTAWAYEYGLPPDGLPDLDGRWTGA
jgi:gamma-glutamylcyclotransferase (GGCT)/AIG2-like uncharacterized protein YtfP